MKSMKQKLSSKSGASMLMALVFLLFCLLIGGSVLSAASANGSRAARQMTDQQDYLNQRSASLLLADMLKSTDEAAMQLMIKEISEGEEIKEITFMIHGESTHPRSQLQRILYDYAIGGYLYDNSLEGTEGFLKYANYNFVGMTGSKPTFSSASTATAGNISVELKASDAVINTLAANYSFDVDGEFTIDYSLTHDGVIKQPSYLKLTMKCYFSEGNPVTVNGVTTKTTVIRWDDPIIEKGGA